MKKIIKSKNNKQKGFTLIETLVAIFILLITTTGPLTFAQTGLRASFLARDQIVAFYLAQDATETIKNIRDNNSLKKGADQWLDTLVACTGDTGCSMSTGVTPTIASCTTKDICEPLRYNSDTHEYDRVSPTKSRFTRHIFIKEIIDDQEAQIIVKVSWDSNFFSIKSITIQENIYNWVPNYAP